MPANYRQCRLRRYRAIACWLCIVVILSQLAAAVSVDQLAGNVRDPEYAYMEAMLRERVAERPHVPLALFVGSSRVAHGFDAAHAAGSHDVVLFNFGIPGSGPYFQTVTLERLREAGIRPDVLFIEILHTFYNAAGPRSLDHGLLDGARLSANEAAGLLHYGHRSKSGPLKRWAYARAVPMYRHQAEMRDRLGLGVYPSECPSPLHPIDGQGFRPRQVPTEERAGHTAVAHENYDAFYGDFRLDPAPWDKLVQSIRMSQATGARVVCIMMPEGSEFRRLCTAGGESERLRMNQRLREELGVAVIDARDWVADSEFFDQHHLLPDGARVFAERFRIEALEPALRTTDRRIAGP